MLTFKKWPVLPRWSRRMKKAGLFSSQRVFLSSFRYPGFLLILEPFETDNATVPNPVFHFTFVVPRSVELVSDFFS